MGNSKYIGKIYDGRWKVICCKHASGYTLENIYNHEIVEGITGTQMKRIDDGRDFITKIMYRRFAGRTKWDYYRLKWSKANKENNNGD